MNKLITILISFIFLSMVSIAGDLTPTTLEIEGTKISTEAEAKRFASDNYIKKMQLNVLATESIREISIIKLGFDIKNFANKGEKLWEARVKTIEGELRAIIWINPKTEKAQFVIGPWQMSTDEAQKLFGLTDPNDPNNL
jgi:hypothetical protein